MQQNADEVQPDCCYSNRQSPYTPLGASSCYSHYDGYQIYKDAVQITTINNKHYLPAWKVNWLVHM